MKIKTCKKHLVFSAVLFLVLTNARTVFGMYDPQLMRFTGRDSICGSYQEPMTLHAYLYCLNDPINKFDPSGKFGEDLYDEAEDAEVSFGILKHVRDVVLSGATWSNAILNGIANAFTGPESVNYKTLFAIGFASGAVEMQVGMKYGATAGNTVGSTLKTTLNQAFSDDPFLSLGTAIKIGVSAVIGATAGKFAEWYDPEDEVGKMTLFLISLDKNLITYDVVTYKKYFK